VVSHSNIIGYIEALGDGTLVLKDAHYNIRGYFDPRTNRTKDSHFNIIGTGNLLGSLVGR